MLASLQVQAVLNQPDVRLRIKALEAMPKGLYEAFAATIHRIKTQHMSKIALDVLNWVFLARELLTMEELRHALAVEWEDQDLDEEGLLDAEFILECCLGLFIVGESTSFLRLIHKSLQDYLQEQYEKHELFNGGHLNIAKICLTYISFDAYSREVTIWEGVSFGKHVLLGYAIRHWNYHARNITGSKAAVEEIIIDLLLHKYNKNRVYADFLSRPLIGLRKIPWGY